MYNGVIVDTNDLARLMGEWSNLFCAAYNRDIIRTPDGEYHVFIWDGDELPSEFIDSLKQNRYCMVTVVDAEHISHWSKTCDKYGCDGEFDLLVDELRERLISEYADGVDNWGDDDE